MKKDQELLNRKEIKEMQRNKEGTVQFILTFLITKKRKKGNKKRGNNLQCRQKIK